MHYLKYIKSVTMVVRKSVSVLFSAVVSSIVSQTYNEEVGGLVEVFTQSNVYQRILYIIQYLSPSFVETFYIIVVHKSKISSE